MSEFYTSDSDKGNNDEAVATGVDNSLEPIVVEKYGLNTVTRLGEDYYRNGKLIHTDTKTGRHYIFMNYSGRKVLFCRYKHCFRDPRPRCKGFCSRHKDNHKDNHNT